MESVQKDLQYLRKNDSSAHIHCRMEPNTHQSCEQRRRAKCAAKGSNLSQLLTELECEWRHGWLNEVNGGTGGSPDNLNSLIILIIDIVVAILKCFCVLQI